MTHSLRKQLKSIRQSHSPLQQRLRAEAAARHFRPWLAQRGDSNVASYLTHTGELPTDAINRTVWRLGRTLHVPLLHNPDHPSLKFQAFNLGTPTVKNRYGIDEPIPNEHLAKDACEMDLVITPLLGFDAEGNRLGMGGGYYDRTLEFMLDKPPRQPRPFLLGLAYDAQEVNALQRNPWDVPLDAILTESGIRVF